jgi:putative transposase
MLAQEELQAHQDRLGLGEAARREIRLVRESEPSRAVQSGKSNVSARFPSRKMGRTIQAESHTVELAAAYEWEYDAAFLEFWDQPPQILVTGEREGRKLPGWLITPDYFVLHEDWAGWVECKAEEWLERRLASGKSWYVKDSDGRWRYPPGEAYAEALGLRFVVRSSKENKWTTIRNAQLLADYRGPECPEPRREDVRRATEKLRRQPWWILRDYIQAEPALDADLVFRLIADGTVYVDLKEELLAEPEVAHVFRDEVSYVAHRAHLQALTHAAAEPPAAVPLLDGQELLWDGQPWVIVNASPTRVTMKSADGRYEAPPHDDFVKLVRAGAITVPSTSADEKAAQREARYRTASPLDLAIATDRLYSLFPDMGSPKRSYCERMKSKLRAWYREAEDVLGDGLLGLLPRTYLRGNRNRKVEQEQIKIMNDVIDEQITDGRRGLIAPAYGTVRQRCIGAGRRPPSEKTFRLQIKWHKRASEITAAREGAKAAYSQTDFCWRIEHSSPRHGDRPYAVGHIDHTELDLQLKGRRFRDKKMRLWLTALIDAYTRKVLAFYLSFDKPSYRSCMCVVRDCIRRGHRLPDVLVVDKGAEFQSGYFEQLLARMRVTKKIRPTAAGRYGSLVERFFGLTNQEFIHNLWGNTQATRDPRRMSPTHDPKVLAEWDIETFSDAFDGFIERGYGRLEHSALGMSPNEAMAAGMKLFGTRPHKIEPYTGEFIRWTMPSTARGKAKVVPGRGIKINYLYYWSDVFKSPKVEGRVVPVRFNPFDLSFACAFIDGQWIDLQSEYANLFKGRSEREIKLITTEIRERMRKTHQRRAINAELIAAYLREAESERVAAQRERDAEAKSVNERVQSSPAAEPAATRAADQEPAVAPGDVPQLPAPIEDKPWYDEALLDEPLEELGEFA